MKRYIRTGACAAFTAAAVLGLAACNQGKPPAPAAAAPTANTKPPVATVDGKPVSAELFDLFVQGQIQKKPEELTPEQRKQAVDGLVNMVIASQAAEKEGLAKQPEYAARLELERMGVLANALFQSRMKTANASEEQLKAEYDKQVSGMPKQEFHARHILVKTEEEARGAIAQIQKGAKFDDVAKKISLDGSKAQGGDLGWFSPAQMVKPFSDAVEKLTKGEYTKEPVKTDFGWHVIKLEDSRPITPPPYESVKDRLGPMVQQRALREYIDGLRKAAKVEIKG